MTSVLGVQTIEKNRVNAGMPPLEVDTQRAVSPYEFLPSWIFYTPVLLQSLFLGAKHWDIRLPLIANPSIKLSGMVGESKSDILSLAGKKASQWISPFITLTKTDDQTLHLLDKAINDMNENHLAFPIVAKPDLGCRGAGVKLLHNPEQLKDYIASFPKNARFLLQEKAPYQAEAGVFYIRYPGQDKGQIISITLKYAPSVMGDGIRTLQELIEHCPRAGQLSHLYLPRHQDKLDWIPKLGEEFQLAFAGSHSRGSIFRNGNQYISAQLTEKLDEIFDDLEGFHYGRLDIKFNDMEQFMSGEKFTILEINGASSEAAHIWDRNTPLKEIFSTLLQQYRILFDIGAQQKRLGHVTPSIASLLSAWREEKRLTEQYPATD
ncbi:D-alanine--D-alanine ligase [Vibrio amylolyticus]|uniref:D-alanine--D-alanine ligase n=1 Tax=Vibrio amylolyticus TaxID=2847292 RepID=UPI00354B95CE